MIIYDGANDQAPVIGNWCTDNPGTVMSSQVGGCLHVTFNADFSVTEEGWKATIACSIILPVELSRFIGQANETGNELIWTTESEINNQGFFIERSPDGKTFEEIAFINGKGNSFETVDYYFLDKEVDRNVLYYYRLNQVDDNGTTNYSDIISIESLGGSDGAVRIYPIPVIGKELSVEIIGQDFDEIKFRVVNFTGRQTMAGKLSSGLNHLNVSSLQEGAYLLFVEADGRQLHMEKIILAK